MGVMKRIATIRQWNERLAGARTDTEIAAMKRLFERCVEDRKRMVKEGARGLTCLGCQVGEGQ